MAKLTARERSSLPDRAFAYVDAKGRRRLPIHDEPHIRNALARFDRVRFESEAARDRARRRLLKAATRFGIVPVGFVSGQIRSERHARAPDFSSFPTGTVTFVFTDIEGSTPLLAALGDDYAKLLRDVRMLIRTEVRRGGGHTVDVRGDEYFAVFARAEAAVRAAVGLQRAIASHGWSDAARVRVRAGVHTGRSTLTDTGYIGLAVHTVARICSLAHGGQCLVSGKTQRALGALPSGLRLRSLGLHALQGIPKPEALYQLEAEGLRARFATLRHKG